MSQEILNLVEKPNLREESQVFEIGDTVDDHCRILEGEKERIQVFSGIVIARSGSGTRKCSPCAASCRARAFSGRSPPLAAGRQDRGAAGGVTAGASSTISATASARAVRLKDAASIRGGATSRRRKTGEQAERAAPLAP